MTRRLMALRFRHITWRSKCNCQDLGWGIKATGTSCVHTQLLPDVMLVRLDCNQQNCCALIALADSRRTDFAACCASVPWKWPLQALECGPSSMLRAVRVVQTPAMCQTLDARYVKLRSPLVSGVSLPLCGSHSPLLFLLLLNHQELFVSPSWDPLQANIAGSPSPSSKTQFHKSLNRLCPYLHFRGNTNRYQVVFIKCCLRSLVTGETLHTIDYLHDKLHKQIHVHMRCPCLRENPDMSSLSTMDLDMLNVRVIQRVIHKTASGPKMCRCKVGSPDIILHNDCQWCLLHMPLHLMRRHTWLKAPHQPPPAVC